MTVGTAKLLVDKGLVPQIPNAFPIMAASVWGTLTLFHYIATHPKLTGMVMWLFRHEKSTLQPSLQASMQYLYNDR